MQPASIAEIDRDATAELLSIERCTARHEQIHLQLSRMVNEIGGGACPNGSPEGFGIDVELNRDRRDQSLDVPLFDRGHDVDVDRRSRIARKRAGDRSSNCVEDTQGLEVTGNDNGDADRIDRGHGDVSAAASGYAAPARSGPSTRMATRRKYSRADASG